MGGCGTVCWPPSCPFLLCVVALLVGWVCSLDGHWGVAWFGLILGGCAADG